MPTEAAHARDDKSHRHASCCSGAEAFGACALTDPWVPLLWRVLSHRPLGPPAFSLARRAFFKLRSRCLAAAVIMSANSATS